MATRDEKSVESITPFMGGTVTSYGKGGGGKLKESLIYSEYTTQRSQESTLLPGKMLRAKENMECPRCATPRNGIEHGSIGVCTNCNLAMQVFGNGLDIWEDGDETPEFENYRTPLHLVGASTRGIPRPSEVTKMQYRSEESYPNIFVRLWYALFRPELFRS